MHLYFRSSHPYQAGDMPRITNSGLLVMPYGRAIAQGDAPLVELSARVFRVRDLSHLEPSDFSPEDVASHIESHDALLFAGEQYLLLPGAWARVVDVYEIEAA